MMTTPEKFRRRQRIEAGVLLVLGLMGFTFAYLDGRDDAADERRDDAQSECVADNFTELNRALGIRGQLAQQDDKLDRREERVSRLERNATRNVISFVATNTINPPEDLEAARQGFLKVLIAYDKQLERVREQRAAITERREEIAQKREDNPVPPYPAGECD